jgi:hypothetical protein
MQNLPSGLSVEIVLSETVEDAFSLFRGVRYRDVPDRAYDFVFVDGPGYTTKDGYVTFDFDLIKAVAAAEAPIRAVIDKRSALVSSYSVCCRAKSAMCRISRLVVRGRRYSGRSAAYRSWHTVLFIQSRNRGRFRKH